MTPAAMTVEQLIVALQKLPPQAVVVIAGDAGYSSIGGLEFEANGDGMPDEVILQQSWEDD